MDAAARSVTFTHRADLALRLLDTTSGRPVEGGGVRLLRGTEVLKALPKPGGFWVFMGLGRQNFQLGIEAEGYEPLLLPLAFAEGGGPLVQDAQLLPLPEAAGADTLHTLSGQGADILAVDAVPLGDNACLAREYDTRRGLLRIFNPHHLELDKVFYAIVDPDNCCYEALEIQERVTDEAYRVSPRPQKEIAAHFSLCRRVLGRVEAGGAWRLRLRRSAGPRWLVRTLAKGGERFETVDLTSPAPDSG